MFSNRNNLIFITKAVAINKPLLQASQLYSINSKAIAVTLNTKHRYILMRGAINHIGLNLMRTLS